MQYIDQSKRATKKKDHFLVGKRLNMAQYLQSIERSIDCNATARNDQLVGC